MTEEEAQDLRFTSFLAKFGGFTYVRYFDRVESSIVKTVEWVLTEVSFINSGSV